MERIWFVFSFTLVLILHSSMAMTNITTDQSALLALKAHITYDPLNILTTNWSTATSPCNWIGVTCSSRHQRVKSLNISDMGLVGTIPPHIGNLSFLSELDLTNNSFGGQPPQELGHLRRLQAISLALNDFTGTIPPHIGNLSFLYYLNLGGNNFGGSIPREIGNLTMLKYLDLGGNKLSGTIPREIGNLTMLEDRLNLGHNKFTGIIPREIGNLVKLTWLSLSGNNLRGTIPAMIFNISTLEVIAVSFNYLQGKLPYDIGHGLPNVQCIALSTNELIGILPDSISNASNLRFLDVSANKFSGIVPNSLGLRFLQFLNLEGNNFISDPELTFLASLTKCINLKQFGISENPHLNGVLPVSIGNLSTSLTIFAARFCGLEGNIPNEIGNLSNLAFLQLYGNDLTGFIPATLNGLWKLQQLKLGKNNLRGSISNDICHLKNLGYLGLEMNQISGHMPACLGNITSLRYVYLNSNRLTSTIPPNMWTLKDLLDFNVSSNSLSGHVPLEIGNLKVAVTIDLSMNQFLGNIPSTIGDLQNLRNLSLAHNRLQGPIPGSFDKMVSLEFLDLSHNNLSGLIPKSFESLSYLKYFNVSFNNLEGEIPSGGPFTNFTAQSFLWNKQLCGAPRFQVPPCHASSSHRSRAKKVFLLVCIPLVIVSIIHTLVLSILLPRRQKRNTIPTIIEPLPAIMHTRISYNELRLATDGFDESNLLGMGSLGSVYKGTLGNGTILAIKVFNLQLQAAFKSFDTECEILRSLHHRNLTKVITSCSNLDFKSLVLEYMPNGSLEKWLYSNNYFLTIMQRLNIVIDVACALDYLHHGYSMPVVHCDLKPSNVLLDEDLVAHISDFGIAKLLGDEESIAQTMTMATVGYIAPEYGLGGLVSTRCDVYSYGIMLMETFTRKKPTDEMFAGDLSLKRWVNESLPNEQIRVIDANLISQEKGNLTTMVQCVSSIMELALNCSVESPEERISIKDVLAVLKKIRLEFIANRERAGIIN